MFRSGRRVEQSSIGAIAFVCMVALPLAWFSGVARATGDTEATEPGTQIRDDLGPLNTFTAGIGRAHDIAGDGNFSNVGFDYLRRVSRVWEWGVQLDLDWEKDFIRFEGVQVAGIIAYSITSAWPFFAGVGIAGEEHGNSAFFRVGTEYAFYFEEKNRYFFAPGTFLDVDGEDVTFSIMVVLGVAW